MNSPQEVDGRGLTQFPSRVPALRALTVLTRLALLLALLAGVRVDCGVSEPATLAGGAREPTPDCHHERGTPHWGELPGAPNPHHHGGPAGGHCPVYHSCAVDFSMHARLLPASAADPGVRAPDGDPAALPLRSRLPEVPPPRA